MLKMFLLLSFLGCNLAQSVEILELDVISYAQLIQNDADTLQTLDLALHEKGIVGVRGVPGYRDQYERFMTAARAFSTLPEEVKEQYQPNLSLGDTFLGYERGKEKFPSPDGTWVIDDLKTSYYAFVPNQSRNKWPTEVNLQEPFLALGQLMVDTGEILMHKIGLLDGFALDHDTLLGRMLYYRKSENQANPYWCGAHFDHGLFTAILPAVYFAQGMRIEEPEEAGLFVRTSEEAPYKKVVANDMDVMMFQVGEFGQIVTDDAIRATEHRVHKAFGAIERYTLALFFNAPLGLTVHSNSCLTMDTRYGAKKGEACTYGHWHEASFQRFIVK
jgi:isopenicillin N synthase-like dioxygenase